MRQYRFVSVMAALVLAVMASAAKADIGIQFVTVGNAGSAADGTGYGAVGYDYQIGKYEVTASQYTAFLNGVAKTDTYGLYNMSMWSDEYGCKIEQSGSSGSYTYSVASDYANRPVNFVSFWDAARFVNWLHNGQGSGDTESGAYINIGDYGAFAREPDAKYWIPTENEWYKAAYHKNDGVTSNYFDYPTSSDTIDTSMANYGNSVLGTTDVGAYPNASPYGTFDQGGSVWEWNEDVVETNHVNRLLRGGAWDLGPDYLAASYRNITGNAGGEGYFIGFRVASVPEPGSLTLMLCGALAGLLWWRKRTT